MDRSPRPAEAQPRGEWWKAFNDPVLDELIERADQGNTSVRVAAARLAQARAVVRSTDADRSPQVGVGASASRAAGLDQRRRRPRRATCSPAGADLSYEVDLFGRLSRSTRGGDARRAGARKACCRARGCWCRPSVAQTYLALRALDSERALVQTHGRRLPRHARPHRAPLARRRRRRARRGAREHRGRRHRVGGAGARPPARRARARARRAGGRVAVAVLAAGCGMERPRCRSIPAGVPSTVLTRRPDVAAAQHIDARRAVARRRRQGRVVPEHRAHRRRRLRLLRSRRPLQVVGARLGRRRAALAADLRRRPARGRRREHQRAARRRGGAATASRCWSRSRTSRTSSPRCACSPSRPRRRRARSSSASRTTALSGTRYRTGYVSQLELLDAQRSELRNRRQALQVRSALPEHGGAGPRAGRRLGMKGSGPFQLQ